MIKTNDKRCFDDDDIVPGALIVATESFFRPTIALLIVAKLTSKHVVIRIPIPEMPDRAAFGIKVLAPDGMLSYYNSYDIVVAPPREKKKT
jgi:hypothetical protein